MKIVRRVRELRDALEPCRGKGSTTGFVPTMGYLHAGHVALMRRAREECDVVVVSIFVNPLQFGPQEDFDKYPRDQERDQRLSLEAAVDILFMPSTDEIYPDGESDVKIEVGPIADVMEGRFRPGHFVGVATVCAKLFNIVEPSRAYFGKKDAQQVAVIRKVVRGLNMPIEIVGCETEREPDGLAMSSRNSYLDVEERRAARVIPEGLFAAQQRFLEGEVSAEKLELAVAERIASEPGVILQYVEVVDRVSFEPVTKVDGAAIIAVAALVGTTRMIDNIEIGGPDSQRGSSEAGSEWESMPK